MAQIRHIAYRAEDVEAMAKFFAAGLGLEIVERRSSGAIDLSDGTINITVLPATLATPDGKTHIGVDHIGFTVADDAAAQRLIEAAGGKERNGVKLSSAHYELKFEGPEGIVVDLGHWAGTAPISDQAPATVTSP
jgi:catechol 2,3-dioxygenase-like lactoylglutathione lyase family enzyme